MDIEQTIPESVFRRQVAYRASEPCAVSGCGFMLKPDKSGEVRDNAAPYYVAVYVLRGEGSYIDWNGKSHPLTPGCVAQRFPDKRHSTLLVPDGQWAEVFMVLDRKFFEALASYGYIDLGRPVLRPGLRLSLIEKFEYILQEISKGTGPAPHQLLLKAHELLFDMLSLDRASRAPDPHSELVESARELLSNDLMERLPLPELASRFNMSYERFRKVFRERTGVSPGAFRLRRRIEAACRLLAGERLTVKEVAFNLGYPDIHCFSKQFRQVMGIPPSLFRERS